MSGHTDAFEPAAKSNRRAAPSHNSKTDRQPRGRPRKFDRANQAVSPDLSDLHANWLTGKKIAMPDKYGVMGMRDLAMLTVATPLASQTSRSTTSTLPPTAKPTTATTDYNSAMLRPDVAPMPNWAVGLLGGLLSFGLVLAILLYLINFPPRLPQLEEKGWMRSRHKYVSVPREDDVEMRDYGSTGTTSAAEKQAKPRKRNKLSIDTSQTYHGLRIAVPGDKEASPAVAASRERRQSYDEEKLAPRSQPPMSPARFAWEAVTAPIPSIKAFTPRMHLWQPKSSRLSKVNESSYRHPELESGTCTPEDYDMYGTPLASPVSPPAQTPRNGNIFEKLSERVEHAADRLGRMLSAQIEGSSEEGLLLPVQIHEREDADARGSRLRGVC